MSGTSPIGVLLIQLGTPKSTEVRDVRAYLREFLGDPRVLDMAAPARALLLNAIILPFRPRKSAHAYRQIWTEAGSPLTLHTEELAREVAERLGAGYRLAVGMRYQEPSLESAVDQLMEQGCDRLVVLPLFPQYSSAATGSALEAAKTETGRRWNVPEVSTVNWFYDDEGFLAALSESARSHLEEFDPDHVVFSYHGLPESQIRKGDLSGSWCLSEASCCDSIEEVNRFCYRAHSFATTRAVASRLGLAEDSYSTTFQSRLAGQKWIEPYTDLLLPRLAEAGVQRLAVLTPSFTADCLETLEEIGIRGRAQWQELGGADFLLVPCLNASPEWADAVADMVRSAS
ncbi:MAG TPA: ferrochelatase [Acidimicrobiia bacterium]|nr:ferrochelatase [Acidimicrobiia bacterium]